MLDEVRSAFESGRRIVIVSGLDVSDVANQAAELGETVMVWSDEGFWIAQPRGAEPDADAIECEDTADALDYAACFMADAVFVMDAHGYDLAARRAGRKLRALSNAFSSAERRLVLVTDQDLPSELEDVASSVRVEPAPAPAPPPPPEPAPAPAPEPKAEAAPAPEAAPPDAPEAAPDEEEAHVDPRDLRLSDLDALDHPGLATRAWAQRIEGLTDAEVEEIIRNGYHRRSLKRVQDMRNELRGQFAYKDTIIDMLCYAGVARVPLLLLGPPGTAKSQMVRKLCEGMGIRAGDVSGNGKPSLGHRPLFEYLLTRYTTPEEIFGPIDIDRMIKERIYFRVTDGMLPQAEVTFLDEIFKASSAIVNTLLTVLNERLFYNAGRPHPVPLIMTFAASNEPPADTSLDALYDRFPLRVYCGPVDKEHVDELWKRSWRQAYDEQFSSSRAPMPALACTNDFRLLTRVMYSMYGGDRVDSEAGRGISFYQEFVKFFRSLRDGYGISDRSLSRLYAVARSMALLAEPEPRPDPGIDELDVFKYVSYDETRSGDLERDVERMKRGVRL